MEEVPDRNHLEFRKGVWQYRRRVPVDLVRAFGKPMVRQSLNTGSIKEAQKRRNVLDVQYDAQFAALRDQLAGSSGEPSPVRIRKAAVGTPLSRDDVRRIVSDYIDDQTTHFVRSVLTRPPGTREEKSDLEWEKAKVGELLGEPGNPQQQEWVADAFDTLFRGRQFSDVTEAEAAELVRRGLLEIARRQTNILVDDFPLFSNDRPESGTQSSRVTFGAVAREYLNDEVEKASVNERKPQWVDKVTAHVGFLIEFVGEDTPIARVDYDEAKRLQSALARMPANRRKKYPSLTIEQAVERAAAEDARLLSPVSQARYLDFFRGIMALAMAKRLVPGNPATELRPIKQDTLSASEKRPPFTTEQIAEIFDSEFYHRWVPGVNRRAILTL